MRTIDLSNVKTVRRLLREGKLTAVEYEAHPLVMSYFDTEDAVTLHHHLRIARRIPPSPTIAPILVYPSLPHVTTTIASILPT